MKLVLTRTAQARWWQRILGRLAFPTAADPQRPGVRLNRYPHEVIGVAIYPGGRRYVSWVWPVWIVGVPLTREQFNRHARALLDEEDRHG